MGKFKMKGFKAFDMEKNSNNRPDGRAGSSVFQIAGKVYNKFSTSPNKIGELESKEAPQRKMRVKDAQLKRPTKTKEVAGGRKLIKKEGTATKTTRPTSPPRVKVGKLEDSPMDIAMRSVGSSNRLKTRPVRKKENSSDPFKVANQYRRHQSSKDAQRDARARMMKVRRDHPNKSRKEQAMLANTAQYRGYTAKDEFKRYQETGTFGPIGGGRQTAKAESPNKIGSKIAGSAIRGVTKIGRKVVKSLGGTNLADGLPKGAYDISRNDGVVTYKVKGHKGEFSVLESRLKKRIEKNK
jgi:hypothetical protein|tara:strand:- start:641 stop:1528 length:888 start_codon:yes stop_codon:yes gene_type:complete